MHNPISTHTGAREQLMRDLRNVIQDAEGWLRHGSQVTGDEFQAAKAKFERTLSSAKADLIRVEETVVERTKLAAKATDEFVSENPWKAVGVGAVVGILVGMLITRK